MARPSFVVIPLVAAWLVGCVSDDEETAPPAVEPHACAPLELALPDGSCIRPGVPPDGCAEGFTHDGEYGCEVILPAETCPPGTMAVPGESACRPVMPCGSGAWGDLPVDAQSEYVDSGYLGMDSDGSARRPWTTIGQGYAAAAPGALIAVAEGSYMEDVVIDKPVRLWGVCPDKVEIAATGNTLGAIVINFASASGTEVGGVRLRGLADGILVSGAQDVVIDRVWVHETISRGIRFTRTLGTTGALVTGSLIERTREVGIFVGGADVTLEGTVVRGTLPRTTDQFGGRGVHINVACDDQGCDPTMPAHAVVRRSLLEQNQNTGLFLAGSDTTVEATVVRGTLPDGDLGTGVGMSVQVACDVGGGCHPTARANAQVRSSLVEQNHGVGLAVAGADATVEATVVRSTQPLVSDQTFGRGINVQACEQVDGCDSIVRGAIAMRSSLVEENHDGGVVVFGSDATVETTVVRRTLPRASDQRAGDGITIQHPCTQAGCNPMVRSHAEVRNSLVEQMHSLGLRIISSDATLESSVVRRTLPRVDDGFYGDGVAVLSDSAPASATISNMRVEDSSRAGIANFGASVSIAGTHVQCAALMLDGEIYDGYSFVFEDRGGNTCGCPIANGICKSASAGLAPPDPIQ